MAAGFPEEFIFLLCPSSTVATFSHLEDPMLGLKLNKCSCLCTLTTAILQ